MLGGLTGLLVDLESSWLILWLLSCLCYPDFLVLYPVAQVDFYINPARSRQLLYIGSGRVATRDNRTQSETSHLVQLRTSVYKRVNGAFFGTIRFRVPKDECLAYSKRERLR